MAAANIGSTLTTCVAGGRAFDSGTETQGIFVPHYRLLCSVGGTVAPRHQTWSGRFMAVKTESGPGVIGVLTVQVKIDGRLVGHTISTCSGTGFFKNAAPELSGHRTITGGDA